MKVRVNPTTWVVRVVMLGVLVVLAGYVLGQSASRKLMVNLEVAWPNIKAMPPYDRSLIVKAAIKCNLGIDAKVILVSDVLGCVRAGAEYAPEDRERLIELINMADPQRNTQACRQAAATRYGVPESLLQAVDQVEHGGRPGACSRYAEQARVLAAPIGSAGGNVYEGTAQIMRNLALNKLSETRHQQTYRSN